MGCRFFSGVLGISLGLLFLGCQDRAGGEVPEAVTAPLVTASATVSASASPSLSADREALLDRIEQELWAERDRLWERIEQRTLEKGVVFIEVSRFDEKTEAARLVRVSIPEARELLRLDQRIIDGYTAVLFKLGRGSCPEFWKGKPGKRAFGGCMGSAAVGHRAFSPSIMYYELMQAPEPGDLMGNPSMGRLKRQKAACGLIPKTSRPMTGGESSAVMRWTNCLDDKTGGMFEPGEEM